MEETNKPIVVDHQTNMMNNSMAFCLPISTQIVCFDSATWLIGENECLLRWRRLSGRSKELRATGEAAAIRLV